MIPASFAKILPFGQDLDPFIIYFVLPKNEYKKNRGWLIRLNKDKDITSGLFRIKVYPKELLTASKEGDYVFSLLHYSNVMGKVLNPDDDRVRVEHQFIDLCNGNDEHFRKELQLFILQLCRSDLDKIRELRFFPPRFSHRRHDNFYNDDSNKIIEAIFQGLVDFYTEKIELRDNQRLRPYRYKELLRRRDETYNRPRNNFNSNFLSFQVSSSFLGYEAEQEKADMLEGIEISKNEDGTLNINPEDFKILLIKGGYIVKSNEDDKDPWTKPELLTINVNEGNNSNQAERYPHLEIIMGDVIHNIRLKSKEGTLLYMATLLKQKYGFPLKREEIISIFKNIPKKYSKEINRDNIEEYIEDVNLPAYEWIKEIYKFIFGESSFNQWCYQLYTNTGGCSRPFQTGLYQLKEHIRLSMNNSGNNPYTPYVIISSNQDTKKAAKYSKKNRNKIEGQQIVSEQNQDDRFIEYSIKIPSTNIKFSEEFKDLEVATEEYLDSLGYKRTE